MYMCTAMRTGTQYSVLSSRGGARRMRCDLSPSPVARHAHGCDRIVRDSCRTVSMRNKLEFELWYVGFPTCPNPIRLDYILSSPCLKQLWVRVLRLSVSYVVSWSFSLTVSDKVCAVALALT